jgi:uncharacterized protein
MSEMMTRRTFLKKTVSLTLASIFLSTSSYTYARYVEPKQFVVTKHVIQHPLIPKAFDGTKIVQFSDTHLGHFFELEQLQHVINKINHLQPDILFFTGDLIDEPNRYAFVNNIAPILKQVEAPLGKFAIYGNHDHGGYGTEIYETIMKESGFDLLVNEHRIITLLDKSKIAIAGIDDAMLGKPDLAKTFQGIPKDLYTIVMMHEPDIAIEIEMFGPHFQLSGHSHGGQIQVPFYGPLITPPLATQFYEGFYQVGSSNMLLFVNRGLGTTRMPYRFFSKPEIAFFTLRSSL